MDMAEVECETLKLRISLSPELEPNNSNDDIEDNDSIICFNK